MWSRDFVAFVQPRRYSAPRLELIAATLDMIGTELEDPAQLGRRLGVTLGPDWPPNDYDLPAMEFLRDCLEHGGKRVIGWHGWYVVLRNEKKLIGTGGYYGPPIKGAVEIGYAILPAYQRQGFATEFVEALVEMAFEHPRITRVIAHTGQYNAASVAVLKKTEFQQIGGVKIDYTLRFERNRKDYS